MKVGCRKNMEKPWVESWMKRARSLGSGGPEPLGQPLDRFVDPHNSFWVATWKARNWGGWAKMWVVVSTKWISTQPWGHNFAVRSCLVTQRFCRKHRSSPQIYDRGVFFLKKNTAHQNSQPIRKSPVDGTSRLSWPRTLLYLLMDGGWAWAGSQDDHFFAMVWIAWWYSSKFSISMFAYRVCFQGCHVQLLHLFSLVYENRRIQGVNGWQIC